MLEINSIMVGTLQPKVLTEFYTQVFGRPADMMEGDWAGWKMGSCFFSLGMHSEVKDKAQEPQRMILNLETTEVKEEFDRIKGIEGVEIIKEPYEMGGGWIATLADPDGNYFQLTTPWESAAM
jgi:predicted enzyme related to lactoylglutathione lyase